MQQNFDQLQQDIPSYKINKCIGTGSIGQIYQAYSEKLQKNVAIKIYDKEKFDDLNLKYIHQEIELLEQCKNPYVVEFYEKIENENYIYLVQELCDGDLSKIQDDYCKGVLQERFVVFIMRQALQGLSYLHENQIIHRDLKPENIFFINDQGVNLNDLRKSQNESVYRYLKFKIGDLGISKKITEKTKSCVGSPLSLVLAPEVIKGEYYDFQADIYSVGVLIYFLLYGKFPFYAVTLTSIFQLIQQGQIEFPENIQVSQELKELIKSMLQFDQSKRINFKEVYSYKIIFEEGELINRDIISQRYIQEMYSNRMSKLPNETQIQNENRQEQENDMNEFIHYSAILRLIKNVIRSEKQISFNEKKREQMKNYYQFYYGQYDIQFQNIKEQPFYEYVKDHIPKQIDFKCGQINELDQKQQFIDSLKNHIQEIYDSTKKKLGWKNFCNFQWDQSKLQKDLRRSLFSLLNLYYFLIKENQIYDEKIQINKYDQLEQQKLKEEYLFDEISDLMQRTQLSNQLKL